MDIQEKLVQALSMLDIDQLAKMVSNDPPWWFFVLVALIPLSIVIVLRESCCWFFKINSRASTLREIHRSLQRIEEALDDLQSNSTSEGPNRL